jgi:hypothetical protein
MRAMRASRVRIVASLLALSALVVLPAATLGHATLVSGDPTPGSTVETAPSRVTATFDEELVPGKSSIVLVGADGKTVGTGSLAPEDSHVLAVIVPPLGPGTYEVRWTAATADGHLERGTYEFTVAVAPTPTPTSEPSPTEAPSAEPTTTSSAEPASTPVPSHEPSATPQPDGGDAGGTDDSGLGLIGAAAVAGLVLGVVIGWWRRRQGR